MSDLQSEVPSFFDSYSRGQVTAGQIDDFVGQWHDLPPGDERSLPQFLGLTQGEYAGG